MAEQRASLFDELAVVGKAFASAKRLEIIELLAQSAHSVEEVSRATGQGVSTVSAHLQILRAARLVRTRREGARVIYRLAGEDVATLYASLGATARTHSPDVEAALEAHIGSGGEDIAEVSRAELLKRLKGGDITVLDVRPPDEYRAGHIPGALSSPLGELIEQLTELPAGDLVAYCRGAYCVLAHDAVTLLHAHGRSARRLEDGILEWRLADLPIEQGV
jgi:rhodanese-related sulfurtransferase